MIYCFRNMGRTMFSEQCPTIRFGILVPLKGNYIYHPNHIVLFGTEPRCSGGAEPRLQKLKWQAILDNQKRERTHDKRAVIWRHAWFLTIRATTIGTGRGAPVIIRMADKKGAA